MMVIFGNPFLVPRSDLQFDRVIKPRISVKTQRKDYFKNNFTMLIYCGSQIQSLNAFFVFLLDIPSIFCTYDNGSWMGEGEGFVNKIRFHINNGPLLILDYDSPKIL
jgi:hypothetical protein